jgi:hypothetical protein
MVRDFVTSEYDTLIFSACLMVASIFAVRRRFGIASITMLITGTLLFLITASVPFMFGALPRQFADAFGSFPFDIVSRTSKILFGISFVCFIVQQRRASGTPTI